MTFTQMHNRMMSHGTASFCAEAASSCAQSAQTFFNSMMLILGAIIMASIIIARLFALSILGLLVLVPVLVLVVLLITAHFDTPWTRNPA